MDPNDAGALAARAATLRHAWVEPIDDRVAFLEERCRDRKVLDIGCVAHGIDRFDSPDWLHGRVRSAARECVGVDVLAEGIVEMQARGMDALCLDLTGDLEPVVQRGPFDVVVAGEVIEHVGSLDMLFATAAAVLHDDGQLIITSPNPFSADRARAGRRGIVWENVDHIAYVFPSGIAELAERHGLVLIEATTTADPPRSWTPVEVAKRLRRFLRGNRYLTVGYTTAGVPGTQRVEPRLPLLRSLRGRGVVRFDGETFVYVVGHRRG